MPTLPYHVVDVFTDRPYAGNPLAVVLGADDLPTEALQAMAREFNLSETTFPMASDRADYRVRIFTAGSELPFAGHPSIGTAWLLARLGRIPTGRVMQDCGAGILPLEVTAEGATLTGGPATVSEPLDPEPLLTAAGLDAGSLSGLAPVRTVGTGLEWTYLPVTEDAVARAEPNWQALRRSVASMGLAVFSWSDGVAHLRALTEEGFEDPATGSAALGFGVYLAASGLVPDGTTVYRISQGAEIGRPSTLHGTVTHTAGTVESVTVRGTVIPIATGELTPPP
ncbi:MAG TPA: PhzF family phenazine biosynthesis protein [Mycobacteriales bacterium]